MYKTKKEALVVVGGLSAPSKMPCYGYSIPAQECKIGQLMRNYPKTICSKCYALKGRYVFPKVKAALYRRFESLKDPRWASTMAYLIKGKPHFRWHDSGDIQDLNHLKLIVEVVRLTPETLHWLPTREYSIVKTFFENGNKLPGNITLRLSAVKLGSPAPEAMARKYGVQVSSVAKTGYNCPAPTQGNKCLSCRACWNKNIFNITYKQH
jgi:hypothetical protein